jgi:hypothetical protein
MRSKPTLMRHINPGGLWLGAIYLIAVIVAYAIIAYTTKPGNVGYDWIPFVLLAMPWYRLYPPLLLPGLLINTGLMYLLGTLLHMFWGRLIKH